MGPWTSFCPSEDPSFHAALAIGFNKFCACQGGALCHVHTATGYWDPCFFSQLLYVWDWTVKIWASLIPRLGTDETNTTLETKQPVAPGLLGTFSPREDHVGDQRHLKAINKTSNTDL